MATEIFKVLKEFEFDGTRRKLGEEIACRSREGEDLVRKRLVERSGKVLDPHDPEFDPKDQALIDRVNKRAEERHEVRNASAEERRSSKNVREEERDVRVQEKRDKVKAQSNVDEEVHKRIDAMTEQELDAVLDHEHSSDNLPGEDDVIEDEPEKTEENPHAKDASKARGTVK